MPELHILEKGIIGTLDIPERKAAYQRPREQILLVYRHLNGSDTPLGKTPAEFALQQPFLVFDEEEADPVKGKEVGHQTDKTLFDGVDVEIFID